MSGPSFSSRHLAALGVALALAATAFGGLVLPRLADAEPPASMKTPLVQVARSPAAQRLDDGRCRERHLRQVRFHRPDGALPGV
jgi:hypothetical protein